jgi:folate-binding protein YgfZ
VYYRFPTLSFLTFTGQDASRVLNNLCTADLAKLPIGQGVETFICEVRGRTVGHGLLFRTENVLEFIGAPGQSSAIASHADRYIIREDCEPRDEDAQSVGFWIGGTSSGADELWPLPKGDAPYLAHREEPTHRWYQVPWTAPAGRLLRVPMADADAWETRLKDQGLRPGDAADFERQRIGHGFPWFGIDLDASNLPQEADRDPEAISFTKGCYLGQETVARLDALGQVQKKLVRWRLPGAELPAPGSELRAEDRVVGKITSAVVAGSAEAPQVIALGLARRSHFDAGSVADCNGTPATVWVNDL